MPLVPVAPAIDHDTGSGDLFAVHRIVQADGHLRPQRDGFTVTKLNAIPAEMSGVGFKMKRLVGVGTTLVAGFKYTGRIKLRGTHRAERI